MSVIWFALFALDITMLSTRLIDERKSENRISLHIPIISISLIDECKFENRISLTYVKKIRE